jgi:hypothetical protein
MSKYCWQIVKQKVNLHACQLGQKIKNIQQAGFPDGHPL